MDIDAGLGQDLDVAEFPTARDGRELKVNVTPLARYAQDDTSPPPIVGHMKKKLMLTFSIAFLVKGSTLLPLSGVHPANRKCVWGKGKTTSSVR